MTDPVLVNSQYQYCRIPDDIYRQSFVTVREEANLSGMSAGEQAVAIRLIHACGMVDIIDDLELSHRAVETGADALARGCSIFCDVEMVRSGIIEGRLPAHNPIVCTLNDGRVPGHAKHITNTRSAAAVDYWGDDLGGSIVVIGNAPTALFRLLERLDDGAPKPALVIGIPVGFVGAVESKQALANYSSDLPFITVHGRRGGSAMASATLNALAGGLS